MTRRQRRLLAECLIVLAIILALGAVWRWTPVREWINLDTLGSTVAGFRDSLWGPVLTVAAVAVLGAVSFPLSVLVLVSALVFGPWWGGAYALAGAVLGSALGHQLGRWLGYERVRRRGGPQLDRITRLLQRQGITAVVLARLMPMLPFNIINLAAGAGGIATGTFMLGTLLGMVPFILIVSHFADTLYWAVTDPQPHTIAWVAALGLTAVILGYAVYRWMLRQEAGESGTP